VQSSRSLPQLRRSYVIAVRVLNGLTNAEYRMSGGAALLPGGRFSTNQATIGCVGNGSQRHAPEASTDSWLATRAQAWASATTSTHRSACRNFIAASLAVGANMRAKVREERLDG